MKKILIWLAASAVVVPLLFTTGDQWNAFFNVKNWTVQNVAGVMLMLSATGVVIWMIRMKKKKMLMGLAAVGMMVGGFWGYDQYQTMNARGEFIEQAVMKGWSLDRAVVKWMEIQYLKTHDVLPKVPQVRYVNGNAGPNDEKFYYQADQAEYLKLLQ
jgi:hypothetical protein